MYYQDKQLILQDLFGTSDLTITPDAILVGQDRYPVVDDVIILSPPAQQTALIRKRLRSSASHEDTKDFAEDVQFTFGREWETYDKVLPEHRQEFDRYFDLIDVPALKNQRVCDLGCGSGRWSYFLKDKTRELILVDFSDAIFSARRNLADSPQALFFHCDLRKLPFRKDFADLLFCLGVLHHLPTPCLDEVRALRNHARSLLIFLYYALDNRPWYFRALLAGVTVVRLALSRIRNATARKIISVAGTYLIYLPLIFLGKLLKPFGLSSHVPLYDFYHNCSASRIEQDVYDRFFTRIEQRVSRQDINTLTDAFRRVTISPNLPYWHFLCER